MLTATNHKIVFYDHSRRGAPAGVTEWFEPQRIEKFYLDFKMNFFICTDEFFLGMISIEEFPKLTQSF